MVIKTPVNAGNSLSSGLNFSVDYRLLKWWKVRVNTDLYYYLLDGDIDGLVIDNSSVNWNTGLTNTFTSDNHWQFQIVSRYKSESATVQGRENGFFVINASLRKSFSKNKFAFTLQGKDILSSSNRRYHSVTQNVEIIRIKEPRTPTVQLSFTMKLNNYQKMRKENDVMDF